MDTKPPIADDEIITVDPSLGQPFGWIRPGVRAVWTSRSGRQRKLVQVQGWKSRSRVIVQTPQGQDFHVAPDSLAPAGGDVPVPSTTSPRRSVAVDPARDPIRVNPQDVKRVVVKVHGKLRYNGPVNERAGELLTLLAAYGRNMVVTLHMQDGSKQRYRGNGNRIA